VRGLRDGNLKKIIANIFFTVSIVAIVTLSKRF
jgi:hypothetical protein